VSGGARASAAPPAAAACPTETVDAAVIPNTPTSAAARFLRERYAETIVAPLVERLSLEA
jgi:hypothetical protein